MPAKILLVDDEPAVLAGYDRTLYREFEVETAAGGELGLKAINSSGPYAVVISDMRMPGMSGYTVPGQGATVKPGYSEDVVDRIHGPGRRNGSSERGEHLSLSHQALCEGGSGRGHQLWSGTV